MTAAVVCGAGQPSGGTPSGGAKLARVRLPGPRSLLLLLLAACEVPDHPHVHYSKESPERLYDTSFGSVACAYMSWESCGVTLWRCHDGATYRCLINVRERE